MHYTQVLKIQRTIYTHFELLM